MTLRRFVATGLALGTATATDNEGVAALTNNAPPSFPTGTNLVTWTATDTSGNVAAFPEVPVGVYDYLPE